MIALTLSLSTAAFGNFLLDCACSANATSVLSGAGGVWVFTPTELEDGVCDEACEPDYGCIWSGSLMWQAPSGATGNPMMSTERLDGGSSSYTKFEGPEEGMTVVAVIDYQSDCGGPIWEATAWKSDQPTLKDVYHFECETCTEI